MDYRNLGRTGVKVSSLCLGTMNFKDTEHPEEAHKVYDRAVEDGINFFDTSNSYGIGLSEQVLGEWMKQRKLRSRLVVATKFNGVMDSSDPNGGGQSYRHIIGACEDSLRRLQTDHIDLYQIHKPSSVLPIDETLRAMDQLVRDGKVRYLGTTTFPAWRLMESLWASKDHGLHRIVCEQAGYNLLDRRAERELVPMAQSYGIGLIPWSPLASGYLTGKYRRGEGSPKGSRIGEIPRLAAWMFSAPAYDAVEKLISLAEAKGCTPGQLALAWLLNQPGVTAPIIGPKTLEQYLDNVGALHVEITTEDRKLIDEITPPGRCIVPFFDSDFDPPKYSRF